VLEDGIIGVANELTWDAEAFAVATGYDEPTGRFIGLVIPHQNTIGEVTDQTLLVHPDVALAQCETGARRYLRLFGGTPAGTPPEKMTDESAGEEGSSLDQVASVRSRSLRPH
jgi:hypothetical protein